MRRKLPPGWSTGWLQYDIDVANVLRGFAKAGQQVEGYALPVKASVSRNKREGRYAGTQPLQWHYVDGWGWAAYSVGPRRHCRSKMEWLGGYCLDLADV